MTDQTPERARFVMHGGRSAIADGMLHISEQVSAIEVAVTENPGLAFDLARTLVESVCRTVLDERSIPYDQADDLPKLFKTATKNLALLPPAASKDAKARKSLQQTVNGLHAAVQGICELRNAYGFASHGSGAEARPALETIQAIFAAEAADSILGFLYAVHVRERLRPLAPPIRFDENERFNEFVDGAHDPVRIFDSEFRPSEVLYNLEPETYKVYLAEFQPEPTEVVAEA